MTIPVLDLDRAADPWTGAFGRPQVVAARQLVAAFNQQGRKRATKITGSPRAWGVFKLAIRVGHALLGDHYGDEAEELAGLVDVPVADVITANLGYDLAHAGCSTFVVPTRSGPLLSRNLDWDFPRQLLQKHTTVVRVRNAPRGDYIVVTWPGLFGVLTGMAPGRFSVAVNYVHHESESVWTGAVERAALGSWPVPWAVRKSFDEAKDFAGAVRILKSLPLLSPVLFTVAGIRPEDAVVIERGVDTWAIRRAPICTTNHYVSPEFEDDNADLDDMDTVERLADLHEGIAGVRDETAALKLLLTGHLRSPDLQYQAAMNAKAGTLVVRVPGGKAVKVEM